MGFFQIPSTGEENNKFFSFFLFFLFVIFKRATVPTQ